jgi:DeoR family fructose operon transcriptional repressor
LTEERFNITLELLEKKKTVTVPELAELLGTSESTIRRDLNTLDEQGKLRKVHGGATAITPEEIIGSEEDVRTKSQLHSDEKELIGKYAASLIKNDDFVFIDAGTTTEKMIKYIPSDLKAKFVTNGIVHAKMLAQKGLKVFVIGGEIKLSTEAIIGVEAVAELKRYNFTKVFLGANGISDINGLTTPDIDEALLKNKAHEKSYVTYVLADHSKFNRVFAVSFGNLSKVCIITDRLNDLKYKKHTIVKEVTE